MINGVQISLDNDHEIQLVNELLQSDCKDSKSEFALRLNPVVGPGSNPFFSTATKESKFGLPVLEETKEALTDLFKNNKWLNGISFHVGSQGMPLEKLVKGAKVSEIIENTLTNIFSAASVISFTCRT